MTRNERIADLEAQFVALKAHVDALHRHMKRAFGTKSGVVGNPPLDNLVRPLKAAKLYTSDYLPDYPPEQIPFL